MRRLWLLFCQGFTLLVGIYWVVVSLTPETKTVVIEGAAPAALQEAARIAAPAVVSLCNEKSCIGSGVIVDVQGHILTNAHVVADLKQLEARLTDDRRATATLIAADLESDLAVLKIKLDSLPVIAFGDSSALQMGEPVLAIGNPLGLGLSVTSGVVSALDRAHSADTAETLIQIDAAINPGNSGGALVNAKGQLVGIITATDTHTRGLGYAIPIAVAQPVLKKLIDHGRVTRGWIGVNPETHALGVVITELSGGSPADSAGLRAGDVVTHIAGTPMQSVTQFMRVVAGLAPGEPASFTVRRRDRSLIIPVTPQPRPSFGK